MRRALTLVVLSVALTWLGATAAIAADTRAEYIAQVDPVCQATISDQAKAAGPKGFVGPLNHGHLRAAGRSMSRVFAAFSQGVEQVAAIVPPVADAQLIGTWVQDLRAQVPLGNRVAGILIHNRLPRKLLARLGNLNIRTRAVVASFGFHSCLEL